MTGLSFFAPAVRSRSDCVRMLVPVVAFLICACDHRPVTVPAPAPKILVGDLFESLLPEIRYRRITDGMGSSVQGGDRPPHRIFDIDASHYRPLACHWVGIKSLDAIPGFTSDTHFRFKVVAELYSDAAAAKRRDAEFESAYDGHVRDAGHDPEAITKSVIPVSHFAHGRVFYVLVTDMAASHDPNEVGKLKFAMLRQLDAER